MTQGGSEPFLVMRDPFGRFYDWGMRKALRTTGKIVGPLLAVVGLISLPDDLQVWSSILSDDLLSYALILFGVLILAAAILSERLWPYVGRSSLHIKGRTLDGRALMALGKGRAEIDGRIFDGCTFVGPLIMILNETSFGDGNAVHFQNQFEKEGALWPVPQGVNVVQGAFGFKNCRFENCTFRRIGFAVTDEVAADFRTLFDIPAPEN